MSQISSKHKEKCCRLRSFGEHHKFFSRIKKTLYYGKLPKTDRFSLPVTELTAEIFSQAKVGHSLERLHFNDAAKISRNACVSPCSLVLAMLYLDRLKARNPDYLQRVAPSELFLVSLMVSSKFLYDDGEDDEVFMDEWAASGGLSIKELVELEKNFLNAIQWEIYVNEITFWKKLKALEVILARKEGFSRGWFTYTELNTLIENIDFQKVFQIVSTLFTVLLATYTAGLITIVSSMFIVSHVPGNCLQSRFNRFENNKTHLAVLDDVAKTEETEDVDLKLDVVTLSNNACRKSMDAVDVLQTSIILASIQPHYEIGDSLSNNSLLSEDNADDNAEYVTWNWWNSPAMEWLSKTSKFIETFELAPNYNMNNNFFDVNNMNDKQFALQDQIHKATKIRIQDQMEMSWHKEWTDSIKRNLLDYNPLFQDVTS